jgi:hypothetical protein
MQYAGGAIPTGHASKYHNTFQRNKTKTPPDIQICVKMRSLKDNCIRKQLPSALLG